MIRTKNLFKLFVTLVVTSLLIYGFSNAATESVFVDLFFNIASTDELTVTLLGQSAVTSAAGGTATPANIEFNSTTGNTVYKNASVIAGSTQDLTNPILAFDNTGTTNLLINITLNATLPAGSCTMELRYLNDSAPYSVAGLDAATNGIILNTSNSTIDSSFTPSEATWGIWLYSNFSGCLSPDTTVRRFTIWAVGV